MVERTVCIKITDTGTGLVIWDDPDLDPDLDELIDYLIEEGNITDPGTYILENISVPDDDILLEDFAIYTITKTSEGELCIKQGLTTPKVPKLTHWPPK